jgi:hypothetical protein
LLAEVKAVSHNDAVLIVFSTAAAVVTLSVPLLSLLWKAFNLIAELRLQIADNKNQLLLTTNKLSHVNEKWELAAAQLLQRIDHVASRTRGEDISLNLQLREVQNFLSKTTDFEIRSSGQRSD